MKQFAKKLIKWAASTYLLSKPWKILSRVVNWGNQRRGEVIISYTGPERSKIIDLIYEIQGETEMILHVNEAYQICMAVLRTEKINGDVAEVGVYKGGSAKLICETKGNKTLHLFDTFEGIPKVDQVDESFVHKGQHAASQERVKNYLKKYNQVVFYPGVFPDTAKPVYDKKFSFVNLDVDTYESTLNCLKFFYPRMNRGESCHMTIFGR